MSKQRAPSNSDFVAFVTFCSRSSPNQTTWQRTVVVDCTQIELDYGRDFTILHSDNFTIRPAALRCALTQQRALPSAVAASRSHSQRGVHALAPPRISLVFLVRVR